MIDSGSIRFTSLQYLTLKNIELKSWDEEEDELKVELGNYILHSPDAIPLDEKDKQTLEEIMTNDPLSLIEYCDNTVFNKVLSKVYFSSVFLTY